MDGPGIRFRDRETGALRDEPMIGAHGLRFLYANPLGRALTEHLLSREPLNHVYGLYQRTRLSRGAIAEYARRLGIETAEAELPVDRYATLDDFFTRRLKPGARPFDPEPEHLPSPAEGRVLVYPEVTGPIRVKNAELAVPDLLGEADVARRYHGGVAVVIRLAPADYHRFHFPDHGSATRSRILGRGLHSVHPIALGAGAQSFRNKRAVCRLVSRSFGDLVLVEVGALVVGSIVQVYTPGAVARGSEKGYFRFGGSTVILLAEPGRLRLDDDLVEWSARDVETLVKVGTRIGCRPGK